MELMAFQRCPNSRQQDKIFVTPNLQQLVFERVSPGEGEYTWASAAPFAGGQVLRKDSAMTVSSKSSSSWRNEASVMKGRSV